MISKIIIQLFISLSLLSIQVGAQISYTSQIQTKCTRELSNGDFIHISINSLKKTNASGSLLWYKTITHPNLNPIISCIQQTSDGGFIITGLTFESNSFSDLLLIKTDINGNIQWAKTYGQPGVSEGGYWVEQTPAGEYIACGTSKDEQQLYVLKTDNVGNLLWDNSIQLTNQNGSRAKLVNIKPTSDGGYIATGNFDDEFAAADPRAILIKLNSTGNIQWKYFWEPAPGSGFEHSSGKEVWETPTGYVFCGYIMNINNDHEAYLIKTDFNGNLTNSRTYKQANQSKTGFFSMHPTSDGGYIATGGGGYNSLLGEGIVKTDGSLNMQWSRDYAGSQMDGFNSVRQTADGGYSFVDGWLHYKTNTQGIISCLPYTTLVENNPPINRQLLQAIETTIGISQSVTLITTAYTMPDNVTCLTSANVTATNITCNGSADGTATANPTQGTPPYTFSWMPGGANTQTIANLAAGTYSVVVTDNTGTSVTYTVSITEPPAIALQVSSSSTICTNDNINLTVNATGGSGNFLYQWQPGNIQGSSINVSPASDTKYIVTATDQNGCTAKDSVTVYVQACCSNPPVPAFVKNEPSCNGSCNGSISVSINPGTGQAPYSYNWNSGLGNNPGVNNLCAGVYKIVVSDNAGCKDSLQITITDPSPLTTDFSTTDATTGCGPVCINFTPTSQQNIQMAVWDFGDGQTQQGVSVNHCYHTEGDYSVVLSITDVNGCIATVVKNNFVTVHAAPTAGFSYTPDTVSVLWPNISFTDTSVNANSWSWDFGDETNSVEQNPIHTYNDTGNYVITLIVSNEFGCKDTSSGQVYVKGEFVVFTPNTFSPNGDGKNDYFFPHGIGITATDYKLLIFDRWGDLIFESNSLLQGWDGRANNGKDVAQQDVYIWKLGITDVFEAKHNLIGHVNLIK